MKKSGSRFVGVLFVIFGFLPSIAAEVALPKPEAWTNAVHSDFDSDQVNGAVANLCRLLSINPRNRTLTDNLTAIFNAPGTTPEQKAEVLRIEDLLYNIRNLQRRIEYARHQRDQLRNQLIRSGFDPKKTDQGLAVLADEPGRFYGSETPVGNDMVGASEHLRYVSNLLTLERNKLGRQLQHLAEQARWLRSATKQGAETLPAPQAAQLTENPVTVVFENAAETGFNNAPEAPIAPFPEPGRSTSMVAVPEQAVFERDIKIGKLSEQLVELSLKMEDAQALLQEKEKTMEALQGQVHDIEQRFVLEQRIIQEKDREINELRETMGQLGSQSPAIYNEENSQPEKGSLSYLDQDIRSYEDALEESRQVLSEKSKLFNALETELADVQKKYQLTEESLKQKDQSLQKLRQEILEAQEQIEARPAEAEDLLSRKEKEIKELNGVINIYQYALSDTLMTIQEKNATLESLEGELAKLRDLFQGEGGPADRRDALIQVLKDTLREERKREDERNTKLRAQVKLRDQKIYDLKAKLSETERNLETANRAIHEKTAYLSSLKFKLDELKPDEDSGRTVWINIDDSQSAAASNGQPGFTGDEQMAELNGMLSIYKDKLADESASAKERALTISVLEGRLGAMQSQISVKDKVLAQTQDDLRVLRERLEAVEMELKNMKASPWQGAQMLDFDQEVEQLQRNYANIQQFLVENTREPDTINSR